jgi:hypothetical protein
MQYSGDRSSCDEVVVEVGVDIGGKYDSLS